MEQSGGQRVPRAYVGIADRGYFVLQRVEGSVLDVGAGSLHPWCLSGLQMRPTVALDVEEGQIDLSWSKAKVGAICPFVRGDAHSLPFKDRSFDSVVLADVLEHVVDPRRVILEAVRVARRKVVATFPEGWHQSGNPQYTLFDDQKVEELLEGLDAEWFKAKSPYWKGYCVEVSVK